MDKIIEDYNNFLFEKLYRDYRNKAINYYFAKTDPNFINFKNKIEKELLKINNKTKL